MIARNCGGPHGGQCRPFVTAPTRGASTWTAGGGAGALAAPNDARAEGCGYGQVHPAAHGSCEAGARRARALDAALGGRPTQLVLPVAGPVAGSGSAARGPA